MQLKSFKEFVGIVIEEGNRFQRHDINGELTTPRKFTDMQVIAAILALASVVILPAGFEADFVRDTIVFLGIFIGLFVGIIISLHDRSKTLLTEYSAKTDEEKPTVIVLKNYMYQFTALTANAIFFALVLSGLLMITLLHKIFHTDIYDYRFLHIAEISLSSIFCFVGLSLLILHRIVVVYLLVSFFSIAIYSTTSYFSYLLSEYKKMKLKK
jgi:hypothetical protein